jgi:undecaprenyl-diphosphatase
VLGAVQGATEFLPVSSSAHLIILPPLLGWPMPSLTYDVAVHMGTLLAVILYFRAEWSRLAIGAGRALRTGTTAGSAETRLLLLLALATVPAIAAGLILQGPIERQLVEDPVGAARAAAWQLMVTGVLLVFADRLAAREGAAEGIGARGALGVGVAQAAAVLPGISRSGATIAAGLFAGLSRTEAARFSFLLATPIILGAGAWQALNVVGQPTAPGEVAAVVAGFTSAFVVGYVSIGWLLSYLRRAPLTVFVLYVWCAAGLALLWLR